MQNFFHKTMLWVSIILSLSGCSNSKKKTIFNALSPDQSGIHFNNKITDKDSVINEYLYMGGGVGIGDFNNDGLKDIFFSGNQVSSRLYINQGKNHFDDITDSSGVATDGWATGVSIVDINNDGYDDIYVCQYKAPNLLFVNQHNLTFVEKAEAYDLDNGGYSTQAAFFDYDKDGRLDMFLVNYRLNGPNPNMLRPENVSGNSPANDKLYHNKGIKNNHPYFTEVHKSAGITGDGYGLGIAISDFNNDSWPDVYVTNDFLSNNELWLNDRNNHFTNVIDEAIGHQSYASMGVDAADINNDLLPDIITLDMAPEENQREKMQYTFMDYNRYERERSYGFGLEFTRNMLQLNNGVRVIAGKPIPFFSEIGQYAGIAKTDWSWSVLAADFNNDTQKDIYITNGSGRDFLNADFIKYSISHGEGMRENPKKSRDLSQKLIDLGYIKSSNYLYLNDGNFSFKNVRDSSGLAKPSISNGAAYADLDNDGDLDLVVNNINEPASIFINSTNQPGKINPDKHFLQVEFKGPEGNLDGRGAKVFLHAGNQKQMQEEYPERGYLSSVDKKLFFGLGSVPQVDSIMVIWPDKKRQIIKNIPADTLLKIAYNDALPFKKNQTKKNPLFIEVTGRENIHYKHLDVSYNDFNSQPLLPQKFSQLGPFITAADINHDNLTDFFVGGGFNSSGVLFIQQNGEFSSVKFDTTKKYQEDMDCVFFDADNDGDSDLLITYGDPRYSAGSVYYKPRLYLNDGHGHFQLDENAIPNQVRTIAGAVAVADYDGDGYPDVFIGGRVAKMYPKSPRSFLLHNQHGTFTDVTETFAPALKNAGMITSAIWTDINQNKKPDLIIAGEWMPLRIFKNTGSKLQEITQQSGLGNIKGMWRSLSACDLDGDGDTDFIAGNLGTNNDYDVSRQTPLTLYAADIDQNGMVDPVLGYYQKNMNEKRKLYPAFKRDQILRQVPTLQKLFPTNKDYADATLNDIFQTVDDENIKKLTANELQSSIFENKNGQFIQHPLPAQVQFSPVNAIVCDDFDDDGKTDLLIAGNEYQTDVRTGRYDASYGYFLKGHGNMQFILIPPTQSGFIIDGDVKDMKVIKANGKKLILVAVNNDSLRAFSLNKKW